MPEREDTFHDIVESEAAHDYDPEPDYDRPTPAEEADTPVWVRGPRRRFTPVPPPVCTCTGRASVAHECPVHGTARPDPHA